MGASYLACGDLLFEAGVGVAVIVVAVAVESGV
jgi:hypothetical protein